MWPMKNRNDECMVPILKEIYNRLKEHNLALKIHVLDNEFSCAVQKYITSKKVSIQLVKPHNHCVNATETAVKSAKYHMLSALATVDSKCPLQFWDKCLMQVKDSLNMLPTSRRYVSKSALDDTNGTSFYFNRTPISILGTKGLAYDDPSVRASWAPHGTEVIYVGQLTGHYRLLNF